MAHPLPRPDFRRPLRDVRLDPGRVAARAALARERRLTPHLEIETYTWDVLPPSTKPDLTESIVREYEWALDVF